MQPIRAVIISILLAALLPLSSSVPTEECRIGDEIVAVRRDHYDELFSDSDDDNEDNEWDEEEEAEEEEEVLLPDEPLSTSDLNSTQRTKVINSQLLPLPLTCPN